MAQTTEGARKTAAKNAGMALDAYLARLAAGEKRCTRCKEWRSITEFGQDGTRGDGLSTVCLGCRRVKERVSTKGRPSAFKGRLHTPETRARMSQSAKRRPPNHTTPHTLETRRKISQRTRERTPRGEQCHSFKDGKLAERRDQRFSTEYKRWRYDVFVRDHFTCQHCGDARGGNLRAHHVRSFADYPDLRFDVPNGITLCHDCHNGLHRGEWAVTR
jgi:5-methylcytosine-specific restriction endonuclease McrA